MDINKSYLQKRFSSIRKVIIFFIVLMILYFIMLKLIFTCYCRNNSELFAQSVNFFGIIFSIITIALLYFTFIEQRNKNKKDSFETTFFNLLKTQQEISNDINAYFFTLDLDNNIDVKTYNWKRRDFFAFSKNELKKIQKSISKNEWIGVYDNDDINERQYYENKLKNLINQKPEAYEDNNKKIDNCKESLEIMFTNNFYEINKEVYSKIMEMDEKERITKIYDLFYQKYRYAVSHYFKHLYLIILFVKDQSLDKKESKKYINFIQAQMSSYELTLLFYNLFKFPRMKELVIKFDFLDNLYENELIKSSHSHFIEGIILRNK
ncbi:MAG: putative phage abortive infection protein [Bacteroidales bacterium]